MKRMMLFIGVLLALSMMVYARGQGARQKGDGTIQVVATIFPPYDFVREVAGDRVKLSMLLPPGAESHSFEPTPRDMVTLQNCDVFIYGGGDSDAWVDRVLESVDTAKMRIIRMMDVVDVVEEEIVEGMEDDDHDHAEEAFTQEEVQDRPLSDWAGEWQSVYPALLEGTLKPVMEHKAEEGDKTAAEYYEQYKTAYMTDLDKLVITQNDITFYRKDVPVRARYAYKGAAITPRDEGLWVRYQFEVVGEPSAGAPRYIMFSDHLHAPAKSEHFHLYSSDESFDALLKDTHPVHYPTYYPADLSGENLVVQMLGHDHEEEVAYDEHVWTAPQNAKRIVTAIRDALCEADPSHAELFRKNAAAYNQRLDALDKAFQDVVKGARRKTIIFGDRFPFRYFADAYGLTYFAAFPGCSTETEPSAATVAFLIDKIRAEGLPVVFHIELSNEKIADILCEETGAKKRRLHAVHNVSKKDFDGGASYLSLMTENIQFLKEALQ